MTRRASARPVQVVHPSISAVDPACTVLLLFGIGPGPRRPRAPVPGPVAGVSAGASGLSRAAAGRRGPVSGGRGTRRAARYQLVQGLTGVSGLSGRSMLAQGATRLRRAGKPHNTSGDSPKWGRPKAPLELPWWAADRPPARSRREGGSGEAGSLARPPGQRSPRCRATGRSNAGRESCGSGASHWLPAPPGASSTTGAARGSDADGKSRSLLSPYPALAPTADGGEEQGPHHRVEMGLRGLVLV